MKKNNSMRAAGGLMIATMLTTSIVSGTYAKYVTSDSAKDSARVAKFGVTVAASGSLFDTSYKNGDGTITVVSSTDEKVVAPGTKSDEALTFSISGKPEVSVNVAIDVVYEKSTSDVFLKAGTYPDMTTGDPDDTFTLNADYHPIKYTLSKGSDKILNGGTMEDLKSALLVAHKAGFKTLGIYEEHHKDEIEEITEICERYGVEVIDSMFKRKPYEVIEILDICKEKGLKISGNTFRRNSTEFKTIVEECEKQGIEPKGTVFKYGDNVDTDVIIPARYLNSSDPAELATHCMEDIDKDFASNVQEGDIMIAGENFIFDDVQEVYVDEIEK